MIGVVTDLVRQVQALRTVTRVQRLSPAELAAWQLERLQAVLSHAYARVPIHRQRMDAAGVHPRDVCSLDDLQRLPLSDKALVQAHYPAGLVAAGYDATNTIEERTSGSTGKRLTLCHDPAAHAMYLALTLRQYHEMGYRPWHRRTYFRWEAYKTPLLPERIGLLRRYFVSISASPLEQLEELITVRPQLVCGYPSSLLLLALRFPNGELRQAGVRMIELNSEQVRPAERAIIEAAFGCRTYDEYSSFELFQMAFQCREQRYHVVAENSILELLDPAGNPVPPGVMGEVVVTGLNNYAMPFIRYRTRDLASWSAEPCPCGRAHMVLNGIEGRLEDIVTLPSGRRVSPFIVYGHMLDVPGIIEYQYVQDRRDHFTIYLVATESLRETITQQILDFQHAALPDEPIHWKVVFVDRIERGATGKRRTLVVSPEAAAAG